VYWFDDTGRGACHLPESWRVLYRNAAGRFVPVSNKTAYGLKKDTFNKVAFEPVTTDAIQLEIKLQKDWSKHRRTGSQPALNHVQRELPETYQDAKIGKSSRRAGIPQFSFLLFDLCSLLRLPPAAVS